VGGLTCRRVSSLSQWLDNEMNKICRQIFLCNIAVVPTFTFVDPDLQSKTCVSKQFQEHLPCITSPDAIASLRTSHHDSGGKPCTAGASFCDARGLS